MAARFLWPRVFRWREGIRQRNDFADALMSDNPNYLVWRERIYNGLRMDGGVMSALGNSRRFGPRRIPVYPGGLNRSTQHFILAGKDGVWDGTKIS